MWLVCPLCLRSFVDHNILARKKFQRVYTIRGVENRVWKIGFWLGLSIQLACFSYALFITAYHGCTYSRVNLQLVSSINNTGARLVILIRILYQLVCSKTCFVQKYSMLYHNWVVVSNHINFHYSNCQSLVFCLGKIEQNLFYLFI